MLQIAITFLLESLISYITRRCNGEFLDSVFDMILKKFVEATHTTADDELYNEWTKKKNKKKEE